MGAIIGVLNVFLLFIPLVNSEVHLAKRVPQALSPRAASTGQGGWALSAPSCPTDTEACPIDVDGASTCCPKDSKCQNDFVRHFCCPTADSKCGPTIQAIPVCANTSWNMYDQQNGLGGFFCCLPNQIGVLNDVVGDFGACGDASLQYPASRLATSVAQITSAGSATSRSPTQTIATDAGTSRLSTSPTNGSNTLSTTTSASTTNTSSSFSSSATKKLSTGAIAGIAVAAVALIAIACASCLVCFRLGKRQRQKEEEPHAAPLYYSPPVESYKEPPNVHQPELGRSELSPVDRGRAELGGSKY